MRLTKRFLVLHWVLFLEAVLFCSVHAADFYVDPIHGDNKNSGLSPATAWRSSQKITPKDQIIFISEEKNEFTLQKSSDPSTRQTLQQSPGLYAAEQMDQIILGSRNLDGWTPYAHAATVFRAPLKLDAIAQNIEAVRLNELELPQACYVDFLNAPSWAWQADTLFLQSPQGNPDQIGMQVTAVIFNVNAENYSEQPLGGWSPAPTTVWQTALDQHPVHLYRNGDIYAQTDWWWGEDGCSSLPGMLYLRSPSEGPDALNASMSAAMEEGGWSIGSGDFNGDGWMDVATSQCGPNLLIYYGAQTISPTAGTVLAAPEGEAVTGFQLAAAGDVNGDGFDDLLAAMDWGVNRAYLYLGSAQGLSSSAHQVILPPEGRAAFGFGHGLAGAGDLNADGYADLIIAGGGTYVGVYMGSAEGVGAQPNTVLTFNGSTEGEIVRLAGVGDLDGDGFDDIVISNSQTNAASLSAHVFYGSAQGLQASGQTITFQVAASEISRGISVGRVGDINGDEHDDLLLADPYADGKFARQGAAYLFYGNANGVNDRPDLVIENPEARENVRFGESFSGIKDFNQDGFNDLAIASPYAAQLFFFFGSPAGIQATPDFSVQGGYEMGWSLASVGNPTGGDQTYIAVGEEFGPAYLYALKQGMVLPRQVGENQPPTADAGAEQTIVEGDTVYLDGSASEDPDDGIATWQWIQVEGPDAALSDSFAATPSFVTPPTSPEGARLIFNLTVSDQHGLRSSTEVAVNVRDNGITGFAEDLITTSASNGKPMGFKVDPESAIVSLLKQDAVTFINQKSWKNTFLFDLISVNILTDEDGGEISLTCHLSEPLPPNARVVQFDPVTGWRDISAQATFDPDRTRFSLTQVDGQIGDDDKQANSTIVLKHFGVMTGDQLPPNPAANHSSGGGGGCFVDMLH